MSEGVDDTSAQQGGTNATNPHAAWARAGKDRQAAKRADEAHAREAVQLPPPRVRPAPEEIRRADDQAASAFFRRRRSKSAMSSLRGERSHAEYQRVVGERVRRAKERREKDRERVRRWSEAHREQKRASIRRWHEAHPEKTAEYSRRYYERHREEILARGRARRDREPAKVSASAREWQQRNREHLTEWQRTYRAENRDAYERSLRSNREAKMLQRKLKAAGLPPKNVKRSPARERRAHEAEAEQFYERLQTPAERKRLMDGYRPLDEATLASWRERSPLARRRDVQLSRFRRGLDRAAGGAEQIREEARMDSIAHAHRGRGPLDVDAELRQRVFDAAGGREYLAAGGDRHTASVLVEEALEGHAPAVTRPDGHGMVWVPEHTRAGREIAGHWRRRPGG